MTTKQVFNTIAELNYPTVLPTLDLDFANSKTLDPRITFTRSSGGSYVGADGLIKYAGVNEARFDHNPVTGESLGLLIEEPRTNLLLQSEDLGTSWALISGTLSNNSTTAPSGLQSADKLILANGGIVGQVFQALTVASGATVTSSFYIKESGADRVEIVLLSSNNTTPYGRATFNPITGTIAVAASAANGGTNASASVTAAGSGWHRVSVTVTYPAVTAAGVRVVTFMADSSNGDGVKGAFLWGAQLEAGAFPTSYIPTVASTRTRAADNAQITGTNFSSWYNQTNFTIVTDSIVPQDNNIFFSRIFEIYTQASGSFSRLNHYHAPRFVYGGFYTIGSSMLANDIVEFVLITTTSLNARVKAATSYSKNNSYFYLNGIFIGVDYNCNVDNVSRNVMNIGSSIGPTSLLNGTISRLTYYPKTLSNSQLQALTS
jgi:hypothetical protein